MKVLFLSPWYPTPADPMAGLFVRKHAMAVARHDDVCVLHLEAKHGISRFEVLRQVTDGVQEIYVFFPFTDVKIFRQITKCVNYLRAFSYGFHLVLSEFGKPDVTQVSVLTRCGVLAWWLKKSRGIPYVIIEHWSRYQPANFNYHGLLRRRLTEIAARDAAALLAVSATLRQCMKDLNIQNPRFEIINNVVDDFFFHTPRIPRTPGGVFRFLHVSCFDEKPKNVQGILRATRALADLRQDFHLTLVGNGPDWQSAVDTAHNLNLQQFVSFTGTITPHDVAQVMASHDALVMFSRYETAGVIFSESWATGTPVISTPVGIIPQCLNAHNGILVPQADEHALTQAMSQIIDSHSHFSPDVIQQSASDFSFQAVGERLHSIYQDATTH